MQSEPPLERSIEPNKIRISIGVVAYEIWRSERRALKAVTAGKPKSSKAAGEIFSRASCLVNAGLLIEREELIRRASPRFANGRVRQKVMLLRVSTAVEFDTKLTREFVKVFAFNNFVRIVSVRHEKTSLRRKTKRRTKSGLKAGNVSRGFIARKQAVGFNGKQVAADRRNARGDRIVSNGNGRVGRNVQID